MKNETKMKWTTDGLVKENIAMYLPLDELLKQVKERKKLEKNKS
tara:strand:+ start:38 stop:169 length:132 start_codon:yes stop_codon:yes gene_type:complete